MAERKFKSDVRTELMIFLTPHIVQAPSEMAALSASEKAKSDGAKAFDEKELNKFLDTLPNPDAPPPSGKNGSSSPKHK